MPIVDDEGRRLGAPPPRSGTYVPPKPGAAAAMPPRTVEKPGVEIRPTGEHTRQPTDEFLARNLRSAMMSWNQWKPLAPQQTDDTWSKMPQDERDKLTLLPTHTYKMTSFETDRLRSMPGSDLPPAPGGLWNPGAEGRDPLQEGALLTTDAPTGGVERVADPVYSRALTWEQYDKLSDADRAVVDFNGDFLEARAKDFENQATYAKTATKEQKEKYDNDVAEIFGGRGGSETYAPNVLSLLKSVDFASVGQDLDEYLSLDRLVTADEMSTIKGAGKPKTYGGGYIGPETAVDKAKYAAIRQPENLAAIDRMLTDKYAAQIRKVMQDGYLRLKDLQSSMESSRSTETLSYGGVGFNDAVTPGFPIIPTPGSDEATKAPDTLTPDQKMGLLRRGVYEYAINKQNTDAAPMFQWLEENELTDVERSSLWDYVRERLAQDKEWGVPDMVQKNIPKRRTYDETEKFLGMEG